MLESHDLALGIHNEKCNFLVHKRLNNTIKNIPQIKISLRGGGCYNTRQSRQENISYQLLQLLNQINGELNGSKYISSYKLMKDCLNKIFHIYLNSFDNQSVIEQHIYENQFKQIIQNTKNEILNKQTFEWIEGLQCYLELIDISLQSISKDFSFNKEISIINIFIKISKKLNEKEVIELIISAAKFLLIDVQGRYFTQFQKYETFFFFQILSHIVKKQIEARLKIEFCTYFEKIQEQFISRSINWTLHNYWIEFQADLCLFCKQILKRNSNLEGAQKIINFFMKVRNQNGRVQFKQYKSIKNFQFNNVFKFKFENSWINDINNSGLHRLNRILSVLSSQVVEIQSKQLMFQQTKNSSLINEIYDCFKGTQICLLEIVQQISTEEEKCQNKKEQNQLQILLNIYQKIDFIIIVQYYCQNISESQQQQKFENKIDLKEQIQLLNQVIKIISGFIHQVIRLQSKLFSQKNQQIENFLSHSFTSFQIESNSQGGLCFQIYVYRQLLKHALQMQNIYHQKLNKIFRFFELDQKLQENQLKNNFIQEKVNRCQSKIIQKLTHEKENFNQDNGNLRWKLIKKVEQVFSFCQIFINDDDIRKTMHKIFQNIQGYLQKPFEGKYDISQKNQKINNLFKGIQSELDKTNDIQHPKLEKVQEFKSIIETSKNKLQELKKNQQTLQECFIKLQNSELKEEEVEKIFNPIKLNFKFDIQNLIIKGETFFKLKDDSQLLQFFYSSISNWLLEFQIEDINYEQIYKQIEQQIDQEKNDTQNVQSSIKFYLEYFKNSTQLIKNQKQTQKILKMENQISERYNSQPIPNNQDHYEEQIIDFKVQFFQKYEQSTKINIGLRVKEIIKGEIVRQGEIKQLLMEFEYKQNPNQYLQAEINQFIWSQENQNVIMLIIGQKGSGKTTAMRRFEKLLWDCYKSCPQHPNWIPIYIDLSKLEKPQSITFKKAIEKYFQGFQINQVTNFYNEIQQGKVNVVFIFDGCNQIDNCKTIIENNNFQYKIFSQNSKKISLKIIMAIKQNGQNFETLSAKLNFLNTQITVIQPFDYNQQLEYIKSYYKDKLKYSIQKIVNNQPNDILENINKKLFEIDQKFFISLEEVKIILNQYLTQILELLKINQTHPIQDEFKKINYFLENQIVKTLKDILMTPQMIKIAISKLEDQYLNQDSEKVMEQQFKTKFIELKRKSLGNTYLEDCMDIQNQLIKKKLFDIYPYFDTLKVDGKIFQLNEDADLVLQALDEIKMSKYRIIEQFIIEYYKYLNQQNEKDLNNNQEFRNKDKIINYFMIDDTLKQQSLKDFFFAKRILDILQIDKQQINIELFRNQEFNLSSKENKGTVQLLIDELQKINQIKEHLIRIIKLSQYNEDFKRSSSNVLYLLQKLGINLENEDFNGIIIEDTSLKGLRIINCNLQNSKANNIKIDYCNLNYVNLNKAKWENIVCNEFPKIVENQLIKEVIIFHNGQQLAVLKQNGISIWDILTCKKKCIDMQHFLRRIYKQIIISNDESKLFALTNLEIDIWNLSNYTLESTKPIIQSKSICFCLSPDNNLLACSREDNNLILFNLAERENIVTKVNFQVNQLAFDHTSNILICRNNKEIYYCKIEQFNETLNPIKQQYNSLIFQMTKDGTKLISLESQKIVIHNLKSGTSQSKNLNIMINNPNSIALHISKDLQMILIQINDQSIIWNTHTQKIYDLSNKYLGRNLIISEDLKILIIWKGSQLQLQDLQILDKMEQRKEIEDSIKSCEYLPDGQNLFIQKSNKSLFWNISSKTILSQFEPFESYCFNNQQNILVTLSNQVLKIWNIKIKDQIQLLYQSSDFIFVNKILFTNDGNKLILIKDKGRIEYLEIKKEKQNSINLHINSNSFSSIAVSTHQYAIQNQGIITICEVQSKKIVAKLGQHDQIIDSFVYSKDDLYLVSRSKDQKIRIWNMQNFHFVCQFKNQINNNFENHCLWFQNQNNYNIVTNFGNKILYYDVTQYLGNNPGESGYSVESNKSQQNNFVNGIVVEPEEKDIKHQDIPNEFICRNLVISKCQSLMAVAYTNRNQDDPQMESIIIISQSLQAKIFNKISNTGGSQLAFCSNSKFLATNCYEDDQYQVIIWNIESCDHFKQFRIKTYENILINSIVFSAQNNYILISNQQNQFYLSVFQQSKSCEESNFGLHQEPQTQDNLFIDNSKDIQIIDKFTITNTNCKFSNNNNELIYTQSNELKFLDIKNRLKTPNDYYYDDRDQFYFKQNLIIYSFNQRKLIKFNLETQRYQELKAFSFQCKSTTFSQSGKYLAFGLEMEISVWKIDNEKQIQVEAQLQIKESQIDLIKFSKDEQYLITLNYLNNDISIYTIIMEARQIKKIELFQIINRDEKVISLNFHPSNLEFLVITQNGTIHLYKKGEQSQQEFKNFITTTQKELQSFKTSIADFKINSKIKQQNLLQLFIQKGAKN